MRIFAQTVRSLDRRTASLSNRASRARGALNGYLAVYRVEQRDEPVATQEPSNNPLCCFTSETGRGRGVELGVDGELAPGWLIGSGYAYNLYEAGTTFLPLTSTPRHLLQIWTSATLSGAFSRWTVGGSLRAQTAAPGVEGELCEPQLPTCALGTLSTMSPYAVLDLRAGYRLSRNWQMALSVNNAFDKRYYVSQDTPDLGLWYGDPRNVMLRVDAKFCRGPSGIPPGTLVRGRLEEPGLKISRRHRTQDATPFPDG